MFIKILKKFRIFLNFIIIIHFTLFNKIKGKKRFVIKFLDNSNIQGKVF